MSGTEKNLVALCKPSSINGPKFLSDKDCHWHGMQLPKHTDLKCLNLAYQADVLFN